MNHIGQMCQFEPALQYGKVDPLKDIYRFFTVWECFTDPTVPTARKRAENAMQVMVRLGVTNDDLDRMPPGLAQPIREALRTCQTLPSGDWSATAYQLILRPDLAQMATGDASHMTSRDSFRQVDKHLVIDVFLFVTLHFRLTCFCRTLHGPVQLWESSFPWHTRQWNLNFPPFLGLSLT